MKKYTILFILFLTGLLASCEDWLNVTPKAQIETDLLFQSEGGFKDALWGIYTNMTAPATYGREMTFGLVDVIGQVYSNIGAGVNTNAYIDARVYDYASSRTEALIDGIWQGNYTTIANLNNLIANLKTTDPLMFAKNNHEVILGEALGLRAFLHFDLLRLFAPSYKAGAAAKAIPYVTTFGLNVTPTYTVSAVIDSALRDLTEAARVLQPVDPIVTGEEIAATDDEGYLLNRNLHMNYYAVKAVMARVYLYKGDLTNAAACADEVIRSEKFAWTPTDQMAVPDVSQRDRTFTPEHVFALHVWNMNANVYSLMGSPSISGLHVTTAGLTRIYPHPTDWRRLYYWEVTSSNANHCNKLWQPEGMPVEYANRMPLIRLPELYLISAEATLDTDLPNSIARLNDIRAHRAITERLPDGAAAAALQEEIKQEYLREFICEGLMFFYYKRTDAERMEGIVTDFDKTKYAFPMPAEEIEYGQRELN
jgi:hypothetical protein